MEYGLLFRKTSTCYSNPDIEYLDETSDYKLKILAKRQGVDVAELKQKNENINSSLEYLTKENHGRVYAGGFLRDALLSKRAEAPEKWNNDIRKKAIKSAIYKNVRQYGAYRGGVGHKLIFSMSSDLEKKLDDSGLNVDEMMAKEVKKIMYSFQNKFHKGEKIGFAWGIHHDTAHRHIHIYLCNRTDTGRHVAMSSPLQGRRRKYQQKDQMGYIKAQLQLAQERILKQINEVENGVLSQKPSEVFFSKVSSGLIDESFAEEDERLDAMRRQLNLKRLQLAEQQDVIRKRFNEYYLHKSVIESGYNKMRRMNREMEKMYVELRQSKSVITSRTLSEIGLLPKSGPVKRFADLMFAVQYSNQKARREAVIQQINATKEEKSRLQYQLRTMNWQRQKFQKEVAQLREDKKALLKQFYKENYGYEKALLKHNYSIFMRVVKDKELCDQYYNTTKVLWRKRMTRIDSSKELRLLRGLDAKAREMMRFSKAAEEVKGRRDIRLASDIKNLDQDNDRGIRF